MLKEIYFNGNLLKKIPNEMYTKPPAPEDQANFERLKEIQQIKIEEELIAYTYSFLIIMYLYI